MVPPVEGADALEEAVVDHHAAPELARGCGAEETEGRADDAQEDQLQVVIGEVMDAGPPQRLPVSHAGPSSDPRALPATIPSHGRRLFKNV